jgi:PKD repeat protein
VHATYTIDPQTLPDGEHSIIAWASDTRATGFGEELAFIIDNILPAADAGPDQQAEAGQKVVFDASGSQDAAYLVWNFGDSMETWETVWPYGEHTYTQPGTYTVTLAVYDHAGNQATDTAAVTVTGTLVTSARWLKENALSRLQAVDAGNEHLADAIESLAGSLDETLWPDDSHLEIQHGHKVFAEEKKAVEKLLKIVEEKGEHADTPIVAEVRAVIDEMLRADALIAKIIIDEAEHTAVNNPDNQEKMAHELAKAKEEMLKANEKAGQGEPDKAVDHFRKAWEHTQKAIKSAVEEQGE